jgi:hypothetical protein
MNKRAQLSAAHRALQVYDQRGGALAAPLAAVSLVEARATVDVDAEVAAFAAKLAPTVELGPAH